MAGAATFHNYLKQQRAMGRNEPTRADKAAYLQGDIQANLAMANQIRQTSLQEQAQQEQARQFGLSHSLATRAQKEGEDQWNKQFQMQKDMMKRQERMDKIRGVSELFKIGSELAPYAKKAWDFGSDFFGGYDSSGYSGDFLGGGDFYGGDYNIGGYDIGDYGSTDFADFGDFDYSDMSSYMDDGFGDSWYL